MAAGAFVIIALIYFILAKKMQTSEYKKFKDYNKEQKEKKFSSEVLFQKLYLTYIKIPFIKRYVLKNKKKT